MALTHLSAGRLRDLLGGMPAGSPAYRALADAVRMLVVDGRLAHDTRLPSERELTRALGVSRTTVTRAYRELAEHGYARTVRGSGTVVRVPGSRGGALGGVLRPHDDPTDPVIDLTCAAPSAPPGTAQAYERAMEQMPAQLRGSGYHPEGVPALREQVARRYTERGVPTDPDQVMITAGALAASSVVARAILGVGDRVLMESPTYPNAVDVIRRSGARPIALPMDADGWHLPSLTATVRQTAPRLMLLIPDFHNPTGALMDADEREATARLAAATHTTLVVDETMVELALDPGVRMPPPMAAYDPDVISIGSMSKAWWGGLHTGWVRAPKAMMGALAEARASLDLGSGVVDQLAAAALLADPEPTLRVRRELLRTSRDAAVAALASELPDWRVSTPRGGVTLWCRMPERVSTGLVIAAERRDVLLASGPRFGVDGGLESYLRLPYTQEPEALVEAVRRIADAYAEVLRHGPRATPVRRPLIA